MTKAKTQAVSIAKDGFVKDCLEKLPSSAWEGQSESSLVGVMRGLLKKREAESPQIAVSVLLRTSSLPVHISYSQLPRSSIPYS